MKLTLMRHITAFLFVFVSQFGTGTSVLIVRTEDNSIYIAADALQLETATGNRPKICKVQKLGKNSYWAAATKFYKTNAGFGLEEIVASIGPEGTIDSKMTRFERAIVTPLESQIRLLGFTDPKEYASYLEQEPARKITPLEIAFVGFENGKARWAVTRFYVHKVNGAIALFPRRDARARSGYTGAVGLGHSRISVDYVIRDLKRFYSNETKTMVEALEKVAAFDRHETVDGPYSVLRIDTNGPTWEQHGECLGD